MYIDVLRDPKSDSERRITAEAELTVLAEMYDEIDRVKKQVAQCEPSLHEVYEDLGYLLQLAEEPSWDAPAGHRERYMSAAIGKANELIRICRGLPF